MTDEVYFEKDNILFTIYYRSQKHHPPPSSSSTTLTKHMKNQMKESSTIESDRWKGEFQISA
jgi:hypothetical protein